MLADALRKDGHRVTTTREPGGTPLGEDIRKVIFGANADNMTPLATALLMSASRSQLLSEIVLPALGRGEIVVVDRFADSTMAYQSYGQGLDAAVVRDLTATATEGVQPDVTILIDVPVEVGLRRTAARGGGNRLDSAARRFHERVRAGYLEMAAGEPGRWILIDGTASPEAVHYQILEGLQRKLEEAVST
jgi:dTMP kinase